jgi:hypothetical protein
MSALSTRIAHYALVIQVLDLHGLPGAARPERDYHLSGGENDVPVDALPSCSHCSLRPNPGTALRTMIDAKAVNQLTHLRQRFNTHSAQHPDTES